MRNKAFKIFLTLAILLGPLAYLGASTGCNYPTSLDSWSNKIAGDSLTVSDVNQFRCAIEKLQSGPLRPSKGSASAPAYSFQGDTDTGLDSLAADQLNFATGGTERVRITNSGLTPQGSADVTATKFNNLPVKIWIPAAGCSNSTASTVFDLPTSNAPTPSCYGTSPHRFAALDFADGGSALTGEINLLLPSDRTSGFTAKFIWFSGSTSTNGVTWTLATVCVADTEDVVAPTLNSTQTVSKANNATANTQNSASISSVTTTGCAAGEVMTLRIGRDPTDGGDTLAATASLIGIELTPKRTF